MGELFGAGVDREYSERIEVLHEYGIAVWDVLKLCTRAGSLDSAIVESSIVINDFARFFEAYPNVGRVFFNGAKAEQSYRRYVVPSMELPNVEFVRLPSTSPAHASLTFERKLAVWRAVERSATADPA